MGADQQQPDAIVRRLVEVLAGHCAGQPTPATARRLRDLADWIDGTHAQQPPLPGVPPPQPDGRLKRAQVVRRVFDYWRRVCDHQQARLSPERARKIQQRLKDGFTEAQLRQAIRGAASSGFHGGDNERGEKYDDIELICRNTVKLEKFMEYGDGSADTPDDAADDPAVAHLQADADQALAEGRIDVYNDLNRQIAAARRGKASGK